MVLVVNLRQENCAHHLLRAVWYYCGNHDSTDWVTVTDLHILSSVVTVHVEEYDVRHIRRRRGLLLRCCRRCSDFGGRNTETEQIYIAAA